MKTNFEFRSYSSIENSYRTLFINKIAEHGYAGETEYLVQEKAHGANISFWKEKDQPIVLGKRTSLLGEEDGFYCFNQVFKDNEEKLEKLFEVIKSKKDGELITIYGELIGGAYPHPDVEKFNQKAVQKGVFYCPYQTIYLFDIRIDGTYVDPIVTEKLFESSDLLYAKTLFKGPLSAALEYPNDFPSKIYLDLELPEIENNTCEGVVIKPAQALYFGNGERIIIKNKNEIFAEKQKQKKVKVPKTVVELPEEIQKYIEIIGEYVNENRLHNVLSKIGDVTQKDFGKIAGLFSKDVIEDFIKDNPDFKTVDDAYRKVITKSVGRSVAEVIRPNFANIIDGVF